MTAFQTLFTLDNFSKLDTPSNNYINALEQLVNHPHIDMVSYKLQQHLILNNLGFVNKDDNGLYFVEFELTRSADLYTKFYLNSNDVRIEFMVQEKGISLNNDTVILPICAPYSSLKIRFTFLNEPHDVILKYKGYLMQTDLRNTLMKKNDLYVSGVRYNNGVTFHL
jgi:hypothetical protein